MLDDIEKMIYSMVGGNTHADNNGCLIITCNAETILTERTLLEKFLETAGNYYGEKYTILEESESDSDGKRGITFVTNLPYDIYQKEIGEFRSQLEK